MIYFKSLQIFILEKKDLQIINDDFVKIMKRLNRLYVEAPNTTKKAVELAKVALKTENEYTYNDEEIDRFLPTVLRKKQNYIRGIHNL